MSSPDPAPPPVEPPVEPAAEGAAPSPGEPAGQSAAPPPGEPPDKLPPALSSMWRLCRLGFRYEPSLMLWAFLLALFAALPDALLALWFKLMADAVVAADATRLRFAAIALGL